MFERFDEGARQALFIARMHTSVRRGPTIDADDLLQGILAVAFDVVARFAPEPEAVEALVAPELKRRDGEDLGSWAERILEDEPVDADTSREAPFDAVAKAVMESAFVEADALDHKNIRPAHLLLGLLRQEGTPAWQALMDAGVTLRGAREAMARDTDAS
jgi:hypothetical protein